MPEIPRSFPYTQVDVFAAEPFQGNPLAVIMDADDLDTGMMARIARWTNLSETCFLLRPTLVGADYRVRIFTPDGELPFAGHPTLGSAHAWLAAGGTPQRGDEVVQECAAGLIRVRCGAPLAFAAPPTVRDGDLDPATLDTVLRALGVPEDRVLAHQWVDNGPGWAAVELPSARQVLELNPDLGVLGGIFLGVFGTHPAGAAADFEVRAFAPGVGEDPVTGSLNASLAQWLQRQGRAGEGYTVTQGTRLGRAGEIHISVEGETVWVGGATQTRFEGIARIPVPGQNRA